MDKTVKHLPSNEERLVEYKKSNSDVYYITQNRVTGKYSIYKKTDAGFIKLGSGLTPPELEKKYIK